QTMGRESSGKYWDQLKENLGNHSIPLVVVDEVHHQEADTWQYVLNELREITPDIYELGLTATPTGHELNELGNKRYTPQMLMDEGVLPATDIIEIETKINLEGIRSKGKKDKHDFVTAD